MSQKIAHSASEIQFSSSLIENELALYGNIDYKPLRFSTAGSVGIGKNTLIRRLISGSNAIIEDQATPAKEDGNLKMGDEVNLDLFNEATLSDKGHNLSKEVIPGYFSTPVRRFEIADSPGQIGYSNNLVTGAKIADVAIILIDALVGVTEETRRLLYAVSLLQIPGAIIAINKIDLVNYSVEVYNTIKKELEVFSVGLNFNQLYFIPLSASAGDNVTESSVKTPWYIGKTLLQLLETVPAGNNDGKLPSRFVVQNVINNTISPYAGFEGRVSGGAFSVGDTILALPSNRLSTIKAITNVSGELAASVSAHSDTIRLNSDIDIKRGDLLVKLNVKYPQYSSLISLHVFWLNDKPLSVGSGYLVRHAADETTAVIKDIRYVVNTNTLENIGENKTATRNEIANITIKTQKPLIYDDYSVNRFTGSLILMDECTLEPVGAGLIVSDPDVYSYNI
jgi:sulfate adenylyltransferase subunit 1